MTVSASPRVYGGSFNPDDRNNPRALIANWVKPRSRVLEVGPGDGVIGAHLRNEKGCFVVGVEVVQEAAAIAAPRFDAMLVGSIEDDAIIASATNLTPYDAIIFADVLEHLVDPWTVLRRVRPLLSPQGCVLVSIPNIAHWTARLNLLMGRFDYTDGYLMDRTHLRWFTWKSVRAMAATCGFTIVDEATVFKPRFARFWHTVNGFQMVLRLTPAEGVALQTKQTDR